jgi:ABC-type Na+ efflux pump permease subunit
MEDFKSATGNGASWREEIIQGAPAKDFTPPKWLIALSAAAMSCLVLVAMKPPFIQQQETSKYLENKKVNFIALLVFAAFVFLVVMIADSDSAKGLALKYIPSFTL